MGKPVVLLLERDAQAIGVAVRELGPPAEPVRSGMEEGFELHVARTAELAVRIAARRSVAVAVLDLTIAGAGLAELVQRIRQHSPSARVVLLTDFAQDRKNALGPTLMKPLHEGRLADAVRTAVRLQQMNEGVERMRTSSGTFAAVQHEVGPSRTPSSPRFPAPIDPSESPPSTRGRTR